MKIYELTWEGASVFCWCIELPDDIASPSERVAQSAPPVPVDHLALFESSAMPRA